jgi:hypothetical protein
VLEDVGREEYRELVLKCSPAAGREWVAARREPVELLKDYGVEVAGGVQKEAVILTGRAAAGDWKTVMVAGGTPVWDRESAVLAGAASGGECQALGGVCKLGGTGTRAAAAGGRCSLGVTLAEGDVAASEVVANARNAQVCELREGHQPKTVIDVKGG